MKKLSHYDAAGSPRMVDVSAKLETRRMARAQAFVRIQPAVLKQLPKNPKGNPLEIARMIACSVKVTRRVLSGRPPSAEFTALLERRQICPL